jgi:hypothetical protein
MIHLKKFNEGVSEWDLNLIRKFCYENLAYLLDGPADINFDYYDDRNGLTGLEKYRIMIKNINSRWSDIESDICPFLELLDEKYSLINIVANNQIEFKYAEFKGRICFSVNEILAGCVEENEEVNAIRFIIKL